jgi:hypothetical protein
MKTSEPSTLYSAPPVAVVTRILFTVLAAAILILMIPHALRIPYRFSITYNEGWNLYHAERAANGEALYSNEYTLTPLIYPPLYFYVLGAFRKIGLDTLTWGRIIAYFSIFAISAIAAAGVRILGGTRFGASIASLFFAGSLAAFAPQYSGMNDPQLAAQVLTCAGFVLFLRDHNRTKLLIWSAILISIGLFFKHNLIAIPAAAGIALLIRSPKRFLQWIAAISLSIGILTLITMLIAGADFPAMILSSRAVSLSKMLTQTKYFATVMLIPLLCSIFWMRKNLKHPISILLVCALIAGAAGSAGFGTAINMFFDAVFALSLIGGMMLSHLQKREPNSRIRSMVPIFLIALFAAILWKVPDAAISLISGKTQDHFRKQQAVFLADLEYLGNQQGSAICGNLTLCYLAGKPFVMDPFNTSQRVVTGSMQEKVPLDLIRSGEVKVIQIKEQRHYESSSTTAQPEMHPDSFFTRNMIAAIRSLYSPERKTSVGTYYLYSPGSESD